ncbi:Uncharacterised protein [Rodentibacter pneumotropicus]|uniref:Uncharacterized protein n=1 Tax=Rodentibacter pneumotropicus TaxID=758 RepID=A0A3S4U472_9PAST|nr:Uncharacterised protein [Rodentibacter pneumotropicus]
MELLLQRIKNPNEPYQTLTLTPTLKLRKSIKNINDKTQII